MSSREDNPARRLEALERLFFAALEQPAERRGQFLDDACRDDAQLRAQLEAMLRADHTLTGSIDTGPWHAGSAAQMLHGGDPAALAGMRVGVYELVQRIGVGGMGTVWRARRVDDHFERDVAIKLLKRGMDSDEIVQRFRRERQLLARLEHANIVRLYDGGATDDGCPYLVLEYIRGQPIHHYCRERGLSLECTLELFARVCHAVHFAHANLIVHRDLKPSNIFVTDDGEPKLLDFGIAKVLGDAPGGAGQMTQTQQRVMTPRYASPEQIRGDFITTASDVYALGVILYELLTGTPPYEAHAGSLSELERAILNTEPTRPSVKVTKNRAPSRNLDPGEAPAQTARPRHDPRRLARALRGDLDTIVLTALRKEPGRRYGSAGELAADVERYLRHDPIAARPDTWHYRTGKFIRRNRTLFSATAAVFLVITVGLVVSLRLYARAEEARAVAAAERDEAEWNLYVASIAAAEGALNEVYLPRRAMRQLQKAPERFRGWEWNYLVSRVDRSLVDMAPIASGERKMCIAWQLGGTLLASIEGVGPVSLRIYDGRTGQRVADLGVIHQRRDCSIAFSPDGTRLVTMAGDGSMTCWHVDGADFRCVLEHRFEYAQRHFRLGSAGRSIYLRGDYGSVHAYDIDATGVRRTWTHQSGQQVPVILSNVSAEGLLAVGLDDSFVVLDAASGAVLRTCPVPRRPRVIRFTSRNRIDAILGNEVVTWDATTLDLLSTATVRSPGGLDKPRFGPTDQTVVFQPSRTHHFVLGSLDVQQITRAYHGYREYGILTDAAISDDGERIAVASWERTLETWDISGTPAERRLQMVEGAPDRFVSVDTLADGSLLAAGSVSGVTLWEPRTGLPLRVYSRPGAGRSNCVRFRPDGSMIAACARGELSVWNVATGQLLWTLPNATGQPNSIAASPDGRHLAFVQRSGRVPTVQLCAWQTGQIVRTFPRHERGARSIRFSSDGRYLACGTGSGREQDARVVVWDVPTGRIVRDLAGFDKIIEDVAWSPDGTRIATCGYRPDVGLWSFVTGEPLPRPRLGTGAYRCFDVAFTRDGRRLVMSNTSGAIRFWDVEHNQEILGLGFISGAQEVAMPADQRWIAAANKWDIIIWDTATSAERVAAEVLRRRYDETPGDWETIRRQLASDRWLLDHQKQDALGLVDRLQRFMAGPGQAARPQEP